ncbi:MAG: LamG domain-containing protein [Gomphosphaeria aponina SAG 52.96 = DSM 107014]|uniref:LamG domain-containing protein n=1 Tax=Gomphosphaeria aponina SAG 52.96 = DSM 107014 TaxID=1521640 RepID=A0A941JMS2_9CHRO|nr:LamG domain-containing protein [Gomphosphaeria aponina SAG 52.96 = DSM 107014]
MENINNAERSVSSLLADDDLIMQLKFDETSGIKAADSSPYGNDNFGQLRKGASFQDVGDKIAGVVKLDGINDYVHVNDSDINLGINAKRTVSLWFKADDVDISNRKQILYEEGGNTKGLNIYINNGFLYVGGWNQPISKWHGTYLASDAISDDTWHHVTLVLDAINGLKSTTDDAFLAYLDGELMGTGKGSQLDKRVDNIGIGSLNQTTKFHDGNAKGTSTNSFAGMIEDVRVYNRALTADEIDILFQYTNAPTFQIGMNLYPVHYQGTTRPFLDLFKMSHPWLPRNDKGLVPREQHLLNLDENGWVKSLPEPEDPEEYYYVHTKIFNQIDGHYPAGKYIVLYDGEGEIEYGWNIDKDEAASTPGRDVIYVDPLKSPSTGVPLTITETDPNDTGNYIRNIHIVQEQYETTFATEIFAPDYLDIIDDFEVLRFMEWMVTNNAQQKEWSDRPTPATATFSGMFQGLNGVPVEYMVELANRVQADPWFNMPHQATDEYIENFAQYVKDHLDPNLDVYLQYSNETWHDNFSQYAWILEQAKNEWPNSPESDINLIMDWYGRRTTEVTQIWDEVFGAEKDRVTGIMAVKSASVPLAERVLEYKWTTEPKSHAEYGIDALSMGAYFGSYLGFSHNQTEVKSWTNDPDGGLDKLFEEVTTGGVLSTGLVGGALQLAYDNIQGHAAVAEQHDLDFIAYEAGQNITPYDSVKNNKAIVDLFIKANRDPRMGEVYRDFYTTWNELTDGGLIMNFSDVDIADKYGSYGLFEYMGQPQDELYKYNAIIGLIG